MYWKFSFGLVLPFCIAFAYSSIGSGDLNQLKSHLPEGIIPNELANTNIDDVRKILREKCTQVSGNAESYDNIETEAFKLFECFNGLINRTVLDEEIKEARPIGELDTVFNKYCSKTPLAIECIENLKKTVDVCLKEDEIQSSDIFMKIVRSMFGFVCYKGGDYIALFIAEGGPQCFEQNATPLGNCLNETVSKYLPTSGLPSLDNLPTFVIGPKECRDMNELEKCIVKALETCEDVTPANIVESLFRYIKKETTCASVNN